MVFIETYDNIILEKFLTVWGAKRWLKKFGVVGKNYKIIKGISGFYSNPNSKLYIFAIYTMRGDRKLILLGDNK